MQDQDGSQNLLFTILHFNDVYDIQPNKKGKYGVAKFESYLRKMKKKYPNHIVLFSGDCFSPSILTNIFEGKHMVKSLNYLGIDVACYGNHQFDLQSNVTLQLAQSCNFPWLLGNIRYKGTQHILGNGKPYIIKEMFGMKLGIFGIAGEDWLGILSEEYQNQLQYDDIGQHSRKMCKLLKQQLKCDMVIALTHMRVYQDKKLPLQAPDIDIILGGHDHIVMKEFINNIPALKNGDNFKYLGVIKVYKKSTNQNQKVQFKGRNYDFDIQLHQIPDQQDDINQQLKEHVNFCMQKYAKSDHLIGFTDVQLQTRFKQIRTGQTNYGNFIVDLTRAYYDVNCCIINAGSIRIDQLIPAGELRYSLISNIINNVMVVKEVKGDTLLKVLQYSVSGLPGFPGSFLSVSGIKFSYDINKNPRVQKVQICGEQLDINRTYTLACNLYIATGGDGFQMLKSCKMIIDPIAGIDLLRLILKFFKGTHNLKGNQKISQIYSKKYSLPQNLQQMEELPDDLLKIVRMQSTRSNRIQSMRNNFLESDKGQKFVIISPSTEGRIISLN